MHLIDKTINTFVTSKIENNQTERNQHNTVNLFYQSQMCSNYKIEELQLQKNIQEKCQNYE